MGKKTGKKGFNWKARQKPGQSVVDDREARSLESKVIGFELKGTSFNDSNALVLPSKKRQMSKKLSSGEAPVGRILSKRRRKHLEKVVDKKRKKAERSEVLAKLEQVQAAESELAKMVSLSAVQTKGLKRQFAEDEWKRRMTETGKAFDEVVPENEVDGLPKPQQGPSRPKKIKLRPTLVKLPHRVEKLGDNVLGFDDEDGSSSEPSDQEDEDTGDVKDPSDSAVEPEAASEKPDVDVTDLKNDNSDSDQPIEAKPESQSMLASKAKEKAEGPKTAENKASPNCWNRTHVPVQRLEEVQTAREKLPIISEEQSVMEAINENPVVVIVGETGSGKTTQVPQFLFEAGYASLKSEKSSKAGRKMIGVTEPRRVAAMAMSNRVGYEMNMKDGEVAYQIRFEGNVKEGQTRIKFMTDGVLLREIQEDFMLTQYSVIVVDEAHERSVFTDILIGFLSRIVPKREAEGDPLKLVIMSATLRVEDFTANKKLFRSPPPVVRVASRQFDVKCHFNRRTPESEDCIKDSGSGGYMAEAFRKVCKIHNTLPEGGILVFLTGQQEVNELVRKLSRLFSKPNSSSMSETSKVTEAKHGAQKEPLSSASVGEINGKLPEIDLDDYKVLPFEDDTKADLQDDFNDDDEDDDLDENVTDDTLPTNSKDIRHPMWILPLYSLLSSDKQARIFQPVPEGHRLCVVATNVAETSLTIPGIKYVVDTGKMKIKLYDKVTGVSTFQVAWTSKAQANQRAGRAGRQSPGHCYRLYSSAVFEHEFPEHPRAEILTRPLEDLVLQMKAMHLDNVANFPFPTSPDFGQIRAAERKLFLLGALEKPAPNQPLKEMEKQSRRAKISRLGRAIAAFPVAPRFGKMLALSHQHPGLMRHTITMVSALSLQEVLLETPILFSDEEGVQSPKEDWGMVRRSWFPQGKSLDNSLLLGDPMVLLRAIGAAEHDCFRSVQERSLSSFAMMNALREFCDRNGLRFKAVLEIRKLRKQLTNEVGSVVRGNQAANLSLDMNLKPPSDDEARLLRQIVLAGSPDQIARRLPPPPPGAQTNPKMKHAYECGELKDPVFMRKTSVLRKILPEWLVYQEIYEEPSKIPGGGGKMYIRGATAIDPLWLPIFCRDQCNLSPPMTDPKPFFDQSTGTVRCYVTGTFGSRAWPLPGPVQIEHPPGPDKFKLFAMFFLDGSVMKGLAPLAASLLSPPVVMIKPWGSLHGKRTQNILNELTRCSVDSRDALLRTLTTDPNFLRSSYLLWVPESVHADVKKSWTETLMK